ncbi:MAG: polymer-forming cytoskeletal protein [Hyphomicrobium sp.]
MLPNFRRTEPELNKIQPVTSANDTAAFQARPFLAAQPRTADRTISMIGPDLTINGNLISKGEVQVDGIVEGDIHGSHVIVGETATINGGIVADEVVIRGHVVGSVRSKRVMLQATSQVEGDIYHQSLSIEQGALFEGKSRRTSEDPRTVAVPAAKVYSLPPQLPELAD